MLTIAVSEDAIDDVLNEVAEANETGERRFPGMSYEQGVEAAIMWLTGQTDEHPYPES